MDWLTFRGSGDFWFGSDDVKKDIKARIENFNDRPVRIYWGVVPVGRPSLVLLPVIGILAKACRHLNVEVDILIADIYAKSKGYRDTLSIEAFETFIEKWMMRLARSENYNIIRESDIAGKLSYIETVASVAGLCPGISVCDALQIADEVALSVDIQVGYPDQHEIFELARKIGIGERQPTHMIIGWVGGKSSIITGPGNISRPNVIVLAGKICMGISEKAATGIIKKMSDSEVGELVRILPECFYVDHRETLIKKICEEFCSPVRNMED